MTHVVRWERNVSGWLADPKAPSLSSLLALDISNMSSPGAITGNVPVFNGWEITPIAAAMNTAVILAKCIFTSISVK